VAGLLLVAPSPPGNLPGARPVPTVPEGTMLRPPAEPVPVARRLAGTRPDGLTGYLAALSPDSPRALNDRCALRIGADAPRITGAPILMIEAGRDDPERHPAGQDAAIARFLGGAHCLLPDAPHCLMVGRWAANGAAPLIDWHRARFPR
jgi:hypothetical protein